MSEQDRGTCGCTDRGCGGTTRGARAFATERVHGVNDGAQRLHSE